MSPLARNLISPLVLICSSVMAQESPFKAHFEARFQDQISSILDKAVGKDYFSSVSVRVDGVSSKSAAEEDSLTYLPSYEQNSSDFKLEKIYIELFLSQQLQTEKVLEIKTLIQKSFQAYPMELQVHPIRGLDQPKISSSPTATLQMAQTQATSHDQNREALFHLLGLALIALAGGLGTWWIARAIRGAFLNLRDFFSISIPERIAVDLPSLRIDLQDLKISPIEIRPLEIHAPVFEMKPLEIQAPRLHLNLDVGVNLPKLQLEAPENLRIEVAPVHFAQNTFKVDMPTQLHVAVDMPSELRCDVNVPEISVKNLNLSAPSFGQLPVDRNARVESYWNQRKNLSRLAEFINHKPMLVNRCLKNQNPEELNNFRLFVGSFDLETRRNFSRVLGEFKQDLLRPLPPAMLRENSEAWLNRFIEELVIAEMTTPDSLLDRLFPEEAQLIKNAPDVLIAETLNLFPDTRIIKALMTIYTKEEFESFVNHVDLSSLPLLNFANPSEHEVVIALRHFVGLLVRRTELAKDPQHGKESNFNKVWANLLLSHLHELTLEEELQRLEEARHFDNNLIEHLEQRYWSLHSLAHVKDEALHRWLQGFSLHCLGTLLFFTSRAGLFTFKMRFEKYLLKNHLMNAAMDWAETISQHADRQELLKYSEELRSFMEDLRVNHDAFQTSEARSA